MTEDNEAKIAIIDNSIDPEVYTPVQHWSQHLNVEWEAFKAKKGDFPNLEGFSHLILTGSEATILEREDWIEQEVEVIGEAVNKRMPILGSCYGHQLLALALVGPDHVRRSRDPEVGWLTVQIIQDNDLLGKQGKFHVFSSHFDEVVDLGDEFKILASTEACRIHAFQFKDKPVWGIQAHPEMDISSSRKFMRSLIAHRVDSSQLYEEALNSPPKDSGLIQRIVQCFIRSRQCGFYD